MIIRNPEFLRSFDSVISTTIMEEYLKSGIKVYCCGQINKVTQNADKSLKIHLWNLKDEKEDVLDGFEELIFAVGRSANTEKLNLDTVKVGLDKKGFIQVNEYQETNVQGVYALGDVCGSYMLTPGNYSLVKSSGYCCWQKTFRSIVWG